jgi:YD repeat-containing protein
VPVIACEAFEAGFEVKFQRRDASWQLHRSNPRQRQRIVNRSHDGLNRKTSESEISREFGAVTDTWAYDRFGNVARQVKAAGLVGLESSVNTTYDSLNRVIRTETGPFRINDAGATTTAVHTMGYDATGQQVVHTDARGNTETFAYDAQRRLKSQWSLRSAAHFNYDGENRRTQRIDRLGKASTTAWDEYGNRIAMTPPTTSSSSTMWAPANQPPTATTPWAAEPTPPNPGAAKPLFTTSKAGS